MPANSPHAEKPFLIPADLDVAGAAEAHALLVSMLAEGEPLDRDILVDLKEGTVTPLALQLLVSAARTFPSDRLQLGPKAAAALNALETPKEN